MGSQERVRAYACRCLLCKTTGCRGSARIGNAFAVSGGGRSAPPPVLIGQAVQRLPAPGRPSGALSAHAPKPRNPTQPRPAKRAARPRQRRTCASGVAWGIVWGGGERAPGGLPGLQNQWGSKFGVKHLLLPSGALRPAPGGGEPSAPHPPSIFCDPVGNRRASPEATRSPFHDRARAVKGRSCVF